MQAVDDHPFARFQAVLDRAGRRAAGHGEWGADDLVLVVDHIDDLPAQVGIDRPVADQERRVRHADGQRTREKAGQERLARVWKAAPEAQGSGLRIDLVVDEIDGPRMRKALLVGQTQCDRHGDFAGRLGFALADQAADVEHGMLVDVEIGVDRVHGDEVRQQRGVRLVAGLDHVADRDHVAADTPAHRGHNLGETEVELRGAQRRLGHPDRRGRLVAVAPGQVVIRLGVHFFPEQFGLAVEVRRDPGEVRLGQGEIGVRPGVLGLVGPGIEFHQHVPLLHQGPFLEIDLRQVPPDARPHLDRFHGVRPPGELRVVGDLFLDRITDLDGDRRRGGRILRRFRAARCSQAPAGQQRGTGEKSRGITHEKFCSLEKGRSGIAPVGWEVALRHTRTGPRKTCLP